MDYTLSINERLLLKRLVDLQEESLLNLARMNHQDLKNELLDDGDHITPFEYTHALATMLEDYAEIRKDPANIYKYPHIIKSTGIRYAMGVFKDVCPFTCLDLMVKLDSYENGLNGLN